MVQGKIIGAAVETGNTDSINVISVERCQESSVSCTLKRLRASLVKHDESTFSKIEDVEGLKI